MIFSKGDIVKYKTIGYHLTSGSGYYPDAIVAISHPLTLVSREGDMMWTSTIQPEHLDIIGKATHEQMKPIYDRLDRSGIKYERLEH